MNTIYRMVASIRFAIITKISKLKLVIDIKDDWIYQTTFISSNFLIKAIERKLEKFCVKNADRIILVTQRSHSDYTERFPQFEDKFELIPNGCDVREYEKYWEIAKKQNPKAGATSVP